MIPVDPQPSREDVLYTFAVESTSGRDLEQYLRDYPQYAAEFVDLSHELSRDACEDEMPLSDKDLGNVLNVLFLTKKSVEIEIQPY
jgi:hypothetical protein